MRKLLTLLALTLTSCALSVVAPDPAADWCNAGRAKASDGPWRALERGAVIPVAERYLDEAVAKLRDRGVVKVSRRYAAELTSSPLALASNDSFYLARAGLVGGPDVSVHQYLAIRGPAVRFEGEIADRTAKLLISTIETSPRYVTRRIPVVVRAGTRIKAAASRCLNVR